MSSTERFDPKDFQKILEARTSPSDLQAVTRVDIPLLTALGELASIQNPEDLKTLFLMYEGWVAGTLAQERGLTPDWEVRSAVLQIFDFHSAFADNIAFFGKDLGEAFTVTETTFQDDPQLGPVQTFFRNTFHYAPGDPQMN